MVFYGGMKVTSIAEKKYNTNQQIGHFFSFKLRYLRIQYETPKKAFYLFYIYSGLWIFISISHIKWVEICKCHYCQLARYIEGTANFSIYVEFYYHLSEPCSPWSCCSQCMKLTFDRSQNNPHKINIKSMLKRHQ